MAEPPDKPPEPRRVERTLWTYRTPPAGGKSILEKNWPGWTEEKKAVSEGSFWPRTWREALPLLVWGVVIFASGFEGVASFLHGEWLQAFLGLGGMFGLTAMLIHWTRIRDNFSDVRWLMAAIMIALVVAALSPYVEQHRWPYSDWLKPASVVPQSPGITQQQVDQKVAAAIVPLQARLDDMMRQRDEAIRERDTAARRSPAPAIPADNGPRVYTNKTVEELWASICEGRTDMQCELFITAEKGKWINTEGSVGFVQPSGQVLLLVGAKNQGVQCIFDEKWKDELSTFRHADNMKIAGKIFGYQTGILLLQDCELRD